MRTWAAVGCLLCCFVLLAAGLAHAEKGVQVMKTAYGGWPNCYRMTNGQVELVATGDVGPRIIRLGFVGGDNVFGEFADQVGKRGGEEWRIYGGHRLWHAPEAKPRTYWPDNGPIQVQVQAGTLTLVQPTEGTTGIQKTTVVAMTDTLTLVQPTEGTTGIQKTMVVAMDADRNHVRVLHRLRNENLWALQLAPWALSMMAQRGLAIVPQPPFAPHPESLLPARPLVQWTYTDMSDPRWRWGTKYLTLRQDPAAKTPQKVGIGNREGWAAYALGQDLFIKTHAYQVGAAYPDFGCSVELFTNPEMLELETVGPLVTLGPGEAVEYVEHWFLFRGEAVANEDAAIDRLVLPRAREALAAAQG